MAKSDKKWKKFEVLVHKIQSDLSPDATVQYDVRVDGYISKQKRQIDILVEQNIGPQRIRIAVECKDLAIGTVVDGPEVESFAKKLEDIRAHKGVIVSATGFSSGAKTLAEAYDIDIMEVVDAEQHEWTRFVTVPSLGEFETARETHFILGGNREVQEAQGTDVVSSPFFDHMGKELGTIVDLFAKQWNAGQIPTEVGYHKVVNLSPNSLIYVDINNKRCEVTPYVSYNVELQRFYGEVPIINAKGFWDVQKQALIVRADSELITDWVSPEKMDSWERLPGDSQPRHKPILIIRGKHVFPHESIEQLKKDNRLTWGSAPRSQQ
jgi:hypothetical protein